MPFSQMSMATPGSSGQAQPGQSKPLPGLFMVNIAHVPSMGSRVRSSTLVTAIAAPQPAAGWW